MNPITPILAEFDQESKTTLRLLERVPQEHLDWAPHAKSTPLRRLAWHVATLPTAGVGWLRAGEINRSAPPNAGPPGTAAEIVDAYRSSITVMKDYLGSLEEAALDEPIHMTRDGKVMMSFSKAQMIRTVLFNHSYHHRGQLSVYLRLLDVPLPSIYGPTADEPM